MIGITAILIFYIYLRHAQDWRLALALLACVVPIGLFLNFLRVILLILQTHYLGEASAQSYTHELSGFAMFALALMLLFALEEPIGRLVRRGGGGAMPRAAAAAPATPPAAEAAAAPREAGQARARRRVVVVGAAMAVAATAVWRAMPRRRIGLADGIPLDRLIPATLHGWAPFAAHDFVLPEADEALQASIYQDVLMRTYVRGGTIVMLLIAYAQTQTHLLHIHRPDKCYPAAGFTIDRMRPLDFAVGADRPIAATVMTATSPDRIEQILYWVRVGNEFPTTFTQQHLAIARQNLAGYAPDGALVRLSLIGADGDAAAADLRDFAAALVAGIGRQGRALLFGPAIAADLDRGPVTAAPPPIA